MILATVALADLPASASSTDVHLVGAHERHAQFFGPMATPGWPQPRVLPPVTPGPDVTVYGYLAYWRDDLDTLPWDDLSHVALFSADVDGAGNLSNTSNWDQASAAVTIGQPYGVEIHLCVTNQNFSSTVLTDLLGSATARQNLISQLVTWKASTGAHGINIDFENLPASRRTQMVQFITDLEAAVGDVVIATPAVDWSDAFDKAALTQHADLFIMGYDYHWSGSSESGPTDPLHGGPGTVWPSDFALDRTIVDYLADGADPERVILGLPLYGRSYQTASNTVPAAALGDGGPILWDNAMAEMATMNAVYEPGAKSMYYYDGSYQTWTNNVDTFQDRVVHALGQDLAGIGFWALNYDSEDAALWSMIHAETTSSAPPPPPDPDPDPGDPPPPPDPDPDPDPGDPPPPPDPGDPPVSGYTADAGNPILAYTGDTVVLSGAASLGPGGMVFSWTQVAGAPVELVDADTARPSFTIPEPGNYTFKLEVGDGTVVSAPDYSHIAAIDREARRTVGEVSGCGCSSTGSAWWGGLLLLPLLARRR